MADLNKFEKMLELLVNEDKEAAQELFHEIVVEKSRDIYESLLEDEDDVEESTDEEVDESEEDEDDEEVDEATDEEVDESDEDLDENFSLDTFEVEADDEDAGDEEADDMDMGDEEGEEAGDEEGDDDMGGDATDDMMGDLGMDTEESAAEDESFQATITPMETKAALSAGEQMREYVEKVSATMGDNGVSGKSAVAGKNDMGGTTANLRGGESKGEGTQGGLAAPTTKEDNAGNVNVPGAKGATKMASQPGHGAEKKGKPETADNKKSTVGK